MRSATLAPMRGRFESSLAEAWLMLTFLPAAVSVSAAKRPDAPRIATRASARRPEIREFIVDSLSKKIWLLRLLVSLAFLSSSGPHDQAFSIGTSFLFWSAGEGERRAARAGGEQLMQGKMLPLGGRTALRIATVKRPCPSWTGSPSSRPWIRGLRGPQENSDTCQRLLSPDTLRRHGGTGNRGRCFRRFGRAPRPPFRRGRDLGARSRSSSPGLFRGEPPGGQGRARPWNPHSVGLGLTPPVAQVRGRPRPDP